MVDAVKYLYDFEGSDDLGNGDFSVLVRIADDYAALQYRVAELEKDAARYRWLRDFGRSEGFSVEEDAGAWIRTHSSSSLDKALDRKLSLVLVGNK